MGSSELFMRQVFLFNGLLCSDDRGIEQPGVMVDISYQIQSRLWGHFHGFHTFYGLFGRQASHNGHVFCTVLVVFFLSLRPELSRSLNTHPLPSQLTGL